MLDEYLVTGISLVDVQNFWNKAGGEVFCCARFVASFCFVL